MSITVSGCSYKVFSSSKTFRFVFQSLSQSAFIFDGQIKTIADVKVPEYHIQHIQRPSSIHYKQFREGSQKVSP